MQSFIFVALQTVREGTHRKDLNHFYHCGLQNVYLKHDRKEIFTEELWNSIPSRKYIVS
jgi:hypothetical protein